MKVEWLPAAEAELNAAADFYDARQPGLGDDLLTEVERTVRLIGMFKYAGKLLGQSDDRLREFVLRRFPYRLIYRMKPGEITIVSVAHDSRRPGHWIDRIQEESAVYQVAA